MTSIVNISNNIDSIQVTGFEYKKLKDICIFMQKSKRQASFGNEHDIYPFYTSSKELTKYCNEIDYIDECIIIGTGGNANIKINKNFSCSADNFIIKIKPTMSNNILLHYLYYWFQTNINKLEKLFHGSTIKHLSKSDLENIEILIPSLNKQNEIIFEVNKLNDLNQKLKIEISQNIAKFNDIINSIINN